ncbi:hypothetical protein thsps21_39240 [Pseudomonas sp. No.21]|jgi:hypothetical protein|uniref:hypothetical protein n=1 Tax=Pseudomonas TaxID=286 RepID=UPI00131494F4|nr:MULTISPECIES: hypothetical protein [Pseudomonas]MDW3711263.1 hypothetical protein [Pseudomonas sp. 2023EL-01195]GJN47668.1 hypothetical protein TUM20249_36540 [Pseudomonas tohonis]
MASHKMKGPRTAGFKPGMGTAHPKKSRGARKERSGTQALVIAGGIVLLVIVLAVLAR